MENQETKNEACIGCSALNAGLERVTSVINSVWVARYGGNEVTDIAALENRVNKLAEDRDCWLANAKANQKEYLRLDALNRQKRVQITSSTPSGTLCTDPQLPEV